MNQNLVIGIVVVLVLLGGGYFLLNMNPASTGTTATTTPPITPSPTPTPTPPPPTASAPSVITDTSVAPSNSTAVVTGKVTPNGSPTTYWYEYGQSSTLGGKTSSRAIGSGWSAISSPGFITGLRANTLYYFRLSAQNAYGTVNGVTQTFNTNSNPPPVGSAPTTKSVAATGVTRTDATLRGEVTPNKAATQYWFEYGKSANLGSASAFVSAGDGSVKVSASLSLTDLSPSTTYYFRLNAQNKFGTVNGAILNFKTAGPATAAPTVSTLSAAFVATTTATLRATVDPNSVATTYWFEYSTDSGFVARLLKTTPERSAGAGTAALSLSADIASLSSKTVYYFRIVAQNSGGTVRGSRLSFKTK